MDHSDAHALLDDLLGQGHDHLLATLLQVVDEPFVGEEGGLVGLLLEVLREDLLLFLGEVVEVAEDVADAGYAQVEVQFLGLVGLDGLLEG